MLAGTLYVVTYEDRITEETIVLGVFDNEWKADSVKHFAIAKNQNAYVHERELNKHYPYEFKEFESYLPTKGV